MSEQLRTAGNIQSYLMYGLDWIGSQTTTTVRAPLSGVNNKVAAHRSFKPPKHDLGRVQSIQKSRRCAICAIECHKKHENEVEEAMQCD